MRGLDAGLADAGAPLPRPCRALSSGRPRSSAARSKATSIAPIIAEIRSRARKLTGALKRRGIKPGDRVATLAWNTHRHIEAWYGIAGAGAVYHTLNPRLFPEQLAWIANHGGARMLMFDICFAPILEQIAPQAEACRNLCRARRRVASAQAETARQADRL